MPSLPLGYALERTALRTLGYTSHDVATFAGRMRVLSAAGRGRRATILLLHGITSQGADFLPLMQRLRCKFRRVVAPDLPGHGQSEWHPSALGRDATGRCLGETLEGILDEPAVVYGNSMGGFAAIRLALSRPDLVRGLFLASPAGALSSPREFDRLKQSLHIESQEDALRFLTRVMHRSGPLQHVLAWGLRRRVSSPATREVVARLGAELTLTPAELAAIAAPVRILWGQSDHLLPRSQLEFFREHLPNARIEELTGFGHAPQLDDPARLTRLLVDFADALSGDLPAKR